MPRAGRVRIIGGQWRSRFIQFTDNEQLRPTPDRIRETLFNWLGQDLTGMTCLDLFAGSGALGFEAASRGARQVTMVEQNMEIMHDLRNSAEALGTSQVELVCMDARRLLARRPEHYDVVFLDPPFKSGLLPEILPLLPSWLTENGAVYVENSDKLSLVPAWSIWKQDRTKHVHYCLLNLNRDG